jgi:predicted transcriptional regulator
MPTQEEVLRAIQQMGCATYKQLKEHFNLNYQGNSNLPQRIKALRKRNLIAIARFGGKTIFLPKELDCTISEAEQILLEMGFRKRKPGMQKGTKIIKEESMLKLLNEVRSSKLISIWQLKCKLNWNNRTLEKYLNLLVRRGYIFEIRVGGLRLFTTSLL